MGQEKVREKDGKFPRSSGEPGAFLPPSCDHPLCLDNPPRPSMYLYVCVPSLLLWANRNLMEIFGSWVKVPHGNEGKVRLGIPHGLDGHGLEGDLLSC